jgi:hypothetical protein
MTMRFPYTPLRVSQPIWTLSGRQTRPQPLLTVALVGPAATLAGRGLLDSGADDTVFPEDLAALVGIDLSTAVVGEVTGVSGVPVAVRFAEVRLRLTDGIEFREWPARVAFAAMPMRRPLFGFAGFLQFYDVVFRGAAEVVELTVNHLYPGT